MAAREKPFLRPRGGVWYTSPIFHPNPDRPASRGRGAAADRRGGDFRTGRGVYTRLLVDDGDVRQHNFLMELVDNPAGLRAIHPAD